jgi:Na+/serine symporter
LRGAFCRSNLLIFKGLLPWPAAGQALRNARNDTVKMILNEYNFNTVQKIILILIILPFNPLAAVGLHLSVGGLKTLPGLRQGRQNFFLR